MLQAARPPKPRARSPGICELTHFALSPDVENRSDNHGHSCDSGRLPPTFAQWHSVRPETLCAVGPVEHCSRQHSPRHVVLLAKYNSLWKSTCTRIYAFLSNIPSYPFQLMADAVVDVPYPLTDWARGSRTHSDRPNAI